MGDRSGVRTTVLLSDCEAEASFAVGLALRNCPVIWYSSLEELVRERSMGSISVLIFHFRRAPKGSLLSAIGRMAVELPAVQKLALTETALSLVVVEYLTACGVELIWLEQAAEELDQLAHTVGRMHECWTWCAAV